MKYDLVIWDFNGTIADDVRIGIDAANVVLGRRGMKKIESVDEYRKIFCFPIKEYYKRLGFDFEKEPYEKPADEWTAEYISREGELKLNDGCLEVFETVKDAGVKQIVLSSSEIEMLRREIDILGVASYFDEILGKNDNYAYGKVDMAKEWSDGKRFKALFIGDSAHDLDAAKAIGADCILFTGGHDSTEHIKCLGVPVVDSIRDVINYL